jgi:hypothetical protein
MNCSSAGRGAIQGRVQGTEHTFSIGFKAEGGALAFLPGFSQS